MPNEPIQIVPIGLRARRLLKAYRLIQHIKKNKLAPWIYNLEKDLQNAQFDMKMCQRNKEIVKKLGKQWFDIVHSKYGVNRDTQVWMLPDDARGQWNIAITKPAMIPSIPFGMVLEYPNAWHDVLTIDLELLYTRNGRWLEKRKFGYAPTEDVLLVGKGEIIYKNKY